MKKILLKCQILLFAFFSLNSFVGFSQTINCNPCQNIASTNYAYNNIDYTIPFWVAFKKKINCIPATNYSFTNLQTTTFSFTDVDMTINGFYIEPSFDNLWNTIKNSTNPISAFGLTNFAKKFRQAVEYKINNQVSTPASISSTYRYVKCIEIVNMTYVGMCGCNPNEPSCKFDLKVQFGNLTNIPPID